MRQYRIWFLIAVMGLFALPSSFADSPMSKRDKIHKFMELSGVGKATMMVMDQQLNSIPANDPNYPPGFAEEFRRTISPDTLMALMVPVYDKYFTDQEMSQLVTFYQSEIGRKLVTVGPNMYREMQTVGQEYEQRVIEKVRSKLKGPTGGK